MQKFIIYSGEDEVIVTTADQEAQTLKEYFTNTGRDVEYWDRQETNEFESAVLVRNGPLQVRH